MTFDARATHVATPAAQTFARGQGVCQDFAHIFVACARTLNIPARYVSGYLKRAEGEAQAAGHAWAEGFVEGLGWVGFDATHKMSPDDAYVRVAAALDYLGAAPIRGRASAAATRTWRCGSRSRWRARNRKVESRAKDWTRSGGPLHPGRRRIPRPRLASQRRAQRRVANDSVLEKIFACAVLARRAKSPARRF